MDLYARLRPALFRLPADRAHDLARLALRVPAFFRLLGRSGRVTDPRLATDLAGIPLANPVGLAPGFDKDGDLLPSLRHLGFGYVAIGSLTPEPRAGNARPRLVRYPDRRSVANSMGLPNQGVDACVRRLRARPIRDTAVVASVAGFSIESILGGVLALEPLVAATEVGLICPNTSESERLRELELVGELVAELGRQCRKPVFVKLPPHHMADDRARVMTMVDLCVSAGIDGVSVNGGRHVVEPGLAVGRGSLAGQDTFLDALRIVGDVAERAAGPPGDPRVRRRLHGRGRRADAAGRRHDGRGVHGVHLRRVAHRGTHQPRPPRRPRARASRRRLGAPRRTRARALREPVMKPWEDVIPDAERRVYAAAGYGSSQPLGRRPVVLIVDTNYAFAGRRPLPIEEAVRETRTSCGEAAWTAIASMQRLLAGARAASVAVLYSTGRRHAALSTMGGWAGKNARAAEDLRRGDDTEIVAEIAPAPGDIVVEKSRPSAFFGTDLAGHLVLLRADTLLVAGGTTSGCVRATVTDAFSLGYRVAVVHECTFDRATLTHKVNLFDMHAKYANVLSLDESLAYLASASRGAVEATGVRS